MAMTMDLDLSDYLSHEEAAVLVAASPDTLFDYLDDRRGSAAT